MSLEILTCHGDDAMRWDTLIASLPTDTQDIHFTSAYARVQEVIGANPLMLVISDPGGFVFHPVDLRVIGAGPDMDIANLYGYGGCGGKYSRSTTVASIIYPPDTYFYDWMKSIGVVSEFCTEHPLLPQIDGDLPEKYVALIDLRRREEQLYSAMRRAHRRSIRKAKDARVVVNRVEINPENMLLMSTLYRQSMARLGAAKRWIFPTVYFDAHANELGEEGCSLYFAGIGRGVDRALLVIHHGETAYAHFLGSTGENTRIGIDEKLYWSAALDLKARGFKTFHLGGGATSSPDDTLLQFKAGFTDWHLPVYRTFRIFDHARYDALCAEKRAQEVAEHGRESRSAFNPLYRREWA